MTEQETIAVLGAGGVMGSAMARNLAGAGFDLRGWNRSREKAEPLTQHGVQVLDSPADAAEGASVILTSGPQDLRPRLDGIFDAIGQRSMKPQPW